ncbi:ANTAR domain-containing protein [Streptomyces sp. KL118A]|uniref:ANTAR domain-containing protein n=1 Tax=Streptomyces sp. KL118A TaxID=3045153 RepID=UPI00278C672A|nr:ANTAR domain-containing protein [Streptomyces sp. KL118A]
MDLLQDLTVRCADLLGVSAASVLLISDHQDEVAAGVTGTVEASDERTREIELAAFLRGESPSRDSCLSGEAVAHIDLRGAEAAARWPWFAQEARAAGFVAECVVPLRQEPSGGEQAVGSEWGVGAPVVGALGLFGGGGEGPLSGEQLACAQMFADLAAVAVARQRSLERSIVECGQLQAALTSRIAIEQAKGVLAERWQCSVDEAFGALRKHARHRRVRLGDFARQVVAGEIDTTEIRQR